MSAADLSPAIVAAMSHVLARLPEPALYARIDGVVREGRFVLMRRCSVGSPRPVRDTGAARQPVTMLERSGSLAECCQPAFVLGSMVGTVASS